MRAASVALAAIAAAAAVAAEAPRGSNPVAGDAPPSALVLTLDPAACRVGFRLGATLHTVEGTFRLIEGQVEIAADGTLSGSVVADATSGETGNARRDRKMHREILKSERHPRIVFRPRRLEGPLPAAGGGTVRVHGEIEIGGDTRPMSVEALVRLDGERLEAESRFPVPYVAWGMPDPSVFLLRVEKQVEVTVTLTGRIGAPPS